MKQFILIFFFLTIIACDKNSVNVDGYYTDIGLSQNKVDLSQKGGEIIIKTKHPYYSIECIYIDQVKLAERFVNRDKTLNAGWYTIKPLSEKSFLLKVKENKSKEKRESIIRVSKRDSVGLLYINQEE